MSLDPRPKGSERVFRWIALELGLLLISLYVAGGLTRILRNIVEWWL